MLAVAAALVALATSGKAAKPSVFLRGPSTFSANLEAFNVSITFSVPVTRFTPSQVSAFGACATSRRWLSADSTGRRYIGQWRVQPFCPRSLGGAGDVPSGSGRGLQITPPSSVTVSVRSDVVPEGNQYSNTLVIANVGPESVAQATMEAPKFFSDSDTALTVQVRFTKSVGYLQPSDLAATGATIDPRWRYDNCIRRVDATITDGADAAAEGGPSATTLEDRREARPATADEPASGARGLQFGGSCTLFIAYVRPSTPRADITVSLAPQLARTNNRYNASSVLIPYSAAATRDKYNVTVSTRNGRNSFSASDRQVYVQFTFSGNDGALASGFTPSDISIFPVGSAVPAADWLQQPGFRVGQPTDTYEIAITPLRNAGFDVYVNENVINAPGNNQAFQNFSFDPSGGGSGDNRPPTVAISGPYGFNSTTRPIAFTFRWAGQTAQIATFAQSGVRLAGAKPVAGSFSQLDQFTFTLSVTPTVKGKGGDDRRIRVWVPQGAVADSLASFNFTSTFRSTLPRIQPSFEAPSFFTYPYVRIYLILDTAVPVDSIKPSDLNVRGGTIRSSNWVGISSSRPPVGNVRDFSAYVSVNSDSNGGYAPLSISLNSDTIRVPNGNNYASTGSSITFAQSTGVRPPVCNLYPGAGEHSGPNDEFVVEVNCSQPVGGGSITSAYRALVAIGARTNGFLGTPSFPATQFFVRVRPLGNADVTLVLPQNVAGSPGNSRATATVPYEPTSPGSPVITTLSAARQFHEGPDLHPSFTVNVNFGRPVPTLGVINASDILTVFNGYIQGGSWAYPPRNNTGYGTVVIVTEAPKDISVSIPAQRVPGVNNLAASIVIPFREPSATATLTGPSGHDGRCPIDLSVTFSEAVTGFRLSGFKAVPAGAVTFAPGVSGTGAGPYTARALPGGTTSGVTVQVDENVVTSPSVGNYESRSLRINYRRPSWRAPIDPVVSVPTSHDGFTPFVVNVTWPTSVYQFLPSDLSVLNGRADSAWKPADPASCQTYSVAITPSSLADIMVSVPASALPRPGNTPANVTVRFRAVPTPTPRPTPSAQPTPSSRPTTRCSGFRALQCNFGSCQSADGGYCTCQQGYTGFSCDTRVPNATASCFNGVKDGAEVDVDCGGSLCGPCAAGFSCASTTDCSGADALCTKGKVCTPRLIDAPLKTGGFVVAARLQLIALGKGAFNDEAQQAFRDAIAAYLQPGTASRQTYSANDILITRVTTTASAAAEGLADPRALGAGALAAARIVTAAPGAPAEDVRDAAERLATGASTVIDVQVNLKAKGDADDTAYWFNYAVGGNRLVNSVSQRLPGIHLASVQWVQPAAAKAATKTDLTPIDDDEGGGSGGGLGAGVVAGTAAGALVLGGILGAGVIIARMGPKPTPKPTPAEDSSAGIKVTEMSKLRTASGPSPGPRQAASAPSYAPRQAASTPSSAPRQAASTTSPAAGQAASASVVSPLPQNYSP